LGPVKAALAERAIEWKRTEYERALIHLDGMRVLRYVKRDSDAEGQYMYVP
jgi:hypothetical protein